jgi:hypothetical protein
MGEHHFVGEAARPVVWVDLSCWLLSDPPLRGRLGLEGDDGEGCCFVPQRAALSRSGGDPAHWLLLSTTGITCT